MRQFPLIFTCLVIFLVMRPPLPAAAQEAGESRLQIETPAEGEAVQGLVQFTVSIPEGENRGGNLAFRYAGFADANWFTIWQAEESLVSGELTVWDTTMITDGNYDVRFQLQMANGELQENLISGIRVRNYTPVETNTPAPTRTMLAGQTNTPPPSTATSQATSTAPVPTVVNPASLSENRVYQTMFLTGAGVLGFFLLLGLYFGLRSTLRKRR